MVESGSSIQKFLTCPKSYFFSYEKLLGSDRYKSSLGYGTLIHAGIEIFTNKKATLNPMDKALFDLLSRHKNPEDQKQIRSDYELARRVLRAWHEHWDKHVPWSNSAIDFMYSEIEWKMNLEDSDFIHVGKSDGVVMHKKYNKLFLYELKTAADRTRDTYIHRLQVDKQISSNILGLRAMGIHVHGVVYDIIWKPALRRSKSKRTGTEEADDEFNQRVVDKMKEDNCFQREIVYRKEEDLEEYKRDLRSQYEAIYIAKKKNAFYRNSGACDKFGSLCEFFSLCIEGRQELEAMFHKRDKRLPELSEGSQ